jgi:hypothetical protein
MPPTAATQTLSYEERFNLAIQAIQLSQVASIRAAAALYDIPESTLNDRLNGRAARKDAQVNNRKLTPTEEQVLLQRIASMDERGMPPTLPFVQRMADLLLSERKPDSSVGKHWVARFVDRHDEIMSKFLRKYDYQRAKCEDPAILKTWFERVQATIAKYGIAPEDIYNFDETGFQMGIIATAKVVTQTRKTGIRMKKGRPTVTQPGNRTFVTVIEGINASGWVLPPMVIFEGKVHQSTWYRAGIPDNWVIGVSENGWTDDELGYKWLTEVFDKHTQGRTVGKYRLLFLDGHGSHFTPQFIDFCEKNSIVWLCCPPHSTHILQPLDVGCFSPLKNAYGRLVQDRAQLGINHIDKPDFLMLYQQARIAALSEKNIKSAFRTVGLVPYDPEKVLSRFQVRTPSPLLQQQFNGPESQLPLQTPYNITELDAQVKALQEHRTKAAHNQTSPTDEALHYLVKGCQLAMHGAALLSDENDRLRMENQRQKKKRERRRSYITHGGILTATEGLQLADEKAQDNEGLKARLGMATERLCSNCRLRGHNKRTCPGNQASIQDSIVVMA